jgi:hypothetical protein
MLGRENDILGRLRQPPAGNRSQDDASGKPAAGRRRGLVVGDEGCAGTRRWRIEALRRYGGETDERVLARHFDGQGRRAPDAPVTDDEHRWMERVVTTVRSWHRDFLVVADAPRTGRHPARVQLLDDAASVSLEVRPDWAGIIPLPDYTGDAAAGFALMWQLCQALARDASCLIVDPAGLAVIEMQLDVDRAREEYGWI